MKKFYITTPIYYPNARPHVGSAYTTIACDAIARYKRMCGYDVAFLTGTDEHGEKLQRAAEAAGMEPGAFVAEKRKLFQELWQTLGIGPFQDTAGKKGGVGGADMAHLAMSGIPSSQTSEGDVCATPNNIPASIDYRFVHTSQNPAHQKAVHWMIEQAKKYNLPYCPRCEKYLEHDTRPAACPTCGGAVEQRSAIFSKRYEGRYCIHDEMYVSEGSEPVNCPNCGRPTELISEDNYFFRLSAFQERLLKYYEEHPEFVQPDFRRHEVESFVRGGKTLVPGSLRDISVSRRRIKWGIPWPGDAEQVVYVWYDALTSYLSGIGFEGEKRSEDFEKYWIGADAEVVHMIGKDILRFHAVYWPAFLWAAGLPLPKTIFAHGWIYYEQDKMSKSKGNVVYPEPLVKAFNELGAPGNDALRYYLLRDTPFGLDGSFSYEGLIQRYNSDLANDLGNLVNRTINMISQYCEAIVPDPGFPWKTLQEVYNPPPVAVSGSVQEHWETISKEDRDFIVQSDTFSLSASGQGLFGRGNGLKNSFVKRFDGYEIEIALALTWGEAQEDKPEDKPYGLIGAANRYLTKNAPWKLAQDSHEDSPSKINIILNAASQAVRLVSVLLWPVMPNSAARIWQQLGCEGRIEDQNIEDLKWGQLKPGTKVGEAKPIFPRLKKDDILRKLHELAEEDRVKDEATKEASSKVETPNSSQPSAAGDQPSPIANQQSQITNDRITIDDFAKVDLRVGTVISAEPIPGATKLLKLQVDIGSEVRQVCAGIAKFYKPEDIVGMKIVLVANLAPRKLRGVESNGMVVAASVGEHGRPVLATFREEVPNGTRLR